jgi:NTE family protein
MRRLPVLAAALVLSLGAPSRPSAAQAAPVAPRPRIGLALGGGAARGLAHIGVLRWLEEHRVPVDLVAGTSMGGLIGGGYATGMTPAELQALMRGIDWDAVLLTESPFADKTFRRKQDRRAFPAPIELGLRHGLTLPRGFNPGLGIGLVLDRIALPYYDLDRFDDLPTPFRCLAMDLVTARPVVLDGGPLAPAMRATMAIPGVFTPVSVDGRLLVDGGVANNVPGDVVREMGAEVVIAVDVSSASQRRGPQNLDNADLITVLDRTLDAMMAAGARRGMEGANLVIVPDLTGLDATSWRASDLLAERGYRAAEAAAARLLPYAVGEAEFAAYSAARATRRRRALPSIRAVRVVGVPDEEQSAIVQALSGNVGLPADPARIERGLLRVAGTDRYESIDYRLATGPAGEGLVVTVHPKTYGPPFLAVGMSLDNIDASHVSASFAARLTTYGGLFGTASETRTDVQVGSRQAVAHEAIVPLRNARPLFVAPHAGAARDIRTSFEGDRTIGETRVVTSGAGIDLGLALGHLAEVRVGADTAYVRGTPLVGSPAVSRVSGSEQSANIRAAYDGQDSAIVPSRGLFARGRLTRYYRTPRVTTDSGLLESSGFWQGEISASAFGHAGAATRLFAIAAGGTSFGAHPALEDFALGGPLRLSAFNPGRIRGPSYALGAVGCLRRVGLLADMLGGDVFAGAWLETGSAFDRVAEASWRHDVSAGLVLDSLIGPIFAGGSVSVDGHRRLYIAIGQVWR